MAKMHALGIDVETTGTNPADDAVVELAAVGLRFDPVTGDHDHFCKVYRTVVDPGRAIPPEASAVHHLTAQHVHGQPKFSDALRGLQEAVLRFEPTILVSHNASFEEAFLPDLVATLTPDNPSWVCTLRLAQHVWPDAPAHKLQTLRYWRGWMQGERTTEAHQAWFDAACSVRLLADICWTLTAAGDVVSPAVLRERSATVPILAKVPFGKHQGKRWSEVPADYCRWIVEKAATSPSTPFDPAVVATAQAALRGVYTMPVDVQPPHGNNPAGS